MSILPAPAMGAASAFIQVVMIDLALASDNAVAVGLAAAGLPAQQRRKAIVLGLACAVAMLIGFALITVQLLQVVGLLLVGGLLLLWVCFNMWRELRDHAETAGQAARLTADGGTPLPKREAKTIGAAMLQILIADLTMSLDNVLAVAGAARRHPQVLVAGLMISITLMGIAASWIARILNRFRWLGYVGLAVILYVAMHMIWEGHRAVMIDLDRTGGYNAVMPQPLAITPAEIAERRAESQ